jgi:hypothetical protein
MVKFPSSGVKDYEDISLHVKQMVSEGTERVEANWVGWDVLKGEYASVNHCFQTSHL